MKPKLVKVGEVEYIEQRNGMPVYVKPDGTEVEGDLPKAIGLVTELSTERNTLRTRAEAAEAALTQFQGIDPAKAKTAIETTANLDAGKLIEAGKVKELETQWTAGYEAKLKDLDASHKAEADKLRAEADDLARGYAFTGSEYVKKGLMGGPHAMAALFGGRFQRVDGRLVGLDGAGKPLQSSTRVMEPADFDDALKQMVAAYPHRGDIERGVGADGGGAEAQGRSGVGDAKTLTRAQFDALGPTQKKEFGKQGGQLVGA